MAYDHVEIRKFSGLFLQPNTFNLPDGALEECSNTVIAEDFIIRKRPGFYTFHTPSSGTINNLTLFENEINAVLGTKAQRISTSGIATDLTGETVSITGNRVSRFVQSNDNLYFTSNNGVMKLTHYNSPVYKSGVPSALDLIANFIQVGNLTTSTLGPIIGNSQVGYRVLFGKKDANKNTLLGAPGDITILTNNKVEATWTSPPSTTVTITTATAHGLITNMLVNITDSSAGDINGSRQIAVTGATTFTVTLGANATGTSGTLSFSYYRKPRLEFTIPTEIKDATDAADFFYQIYRTTASAGATDTPTPNFALIKEKKPTASELNLRTVVFDDDIDEVFLEGATELYTNPNSQEGETQENSRSPLCEDVLIFKDHVFYLNITTKHLFNLNLQSSNITASIWQTGDFVEIKQDTTTVKFVARTGVGNSTVTSESASFVSTTITVNYTAHGLVTGDTIFVSSAIGTGTLPSGQYTIASHAANSFTFVAAFAPTTLTDLDFQGLTNGTDYIFQIVDSATALSSGLLASSVGLVKAINRNASSPVYGRYISSIDDLPGKMFIESKTFNSAEIQFRAVTSGATTPGIGFSPVLTATFTDNVSTQDILPNTCAIAKTSEPEAVPRTNQLIVGSQNSHILRGFALRDSVILLKEDGVYRVDGDAVGNFTATILDNTMNIFAPSAAATINNQVIFLADQGVSLATATSVEIISRQGIEQPLSAVLGNANISTQTSGVGYEAERLYLLTTLAPNTNAASVVYCYNILTNAWTTWDKTFKQAIVGQNNTLFMVSTANTILKQRKNQNKIDYCDESYTVTVNTVASDMLSATISSASTVPMIGDVIIQNNVITRIRSVVDNQSSNYTITFEAKSTLTVGSRTLYKAYESVMKFAPFHAGLTIREKHFAQFQVHTKDKSISYIQMSFTTDQFGGSEVTDWHLSDVAGSGGWGNEPWGFFDWGLEDGIDLSYTTKPAPVIRIYVPRFAARATFIQAYLNHRSAAEPMNIQAIGYQLRAYQERVTK